MGYSGKDLRVLVHATGQIYLKALAGAWRGFALNWWVIFIHLGFLVVLGVLSPLIWMFGSLIGGFILGFLVAFLMASYLATVSSAVNQERLNIRELWPQTVELFSPVIGVLFAWFILSLVSGMALGRPDQVWIRQSLNLILAVLFNPLPEAIYFHRTGVGETFGAAFEFVRDNFIEWFLPFVLLALPILIYSPPDFFALSIFAMTTNPLNMIMLFASPLVFLGGSTTLILILVAGYFIFCFRGALYKQLAGSSRRKRIYQSQFV